MKLKKFAVVVMALLLCIGFVGCKKKGSEDNGSSDNGGGQTTTTYTIEYKLNGGTNNADNPTSYVPGKNIILKSPTKQYYEFEGWFVGETNVTMIKSDQTGNIVLEAKWSEEKHTIQYSLSGGVLPEGAPTEYSTAKGLESLPTPTKDGYTFQGWQYAGNIVTSIAVGDTTDYVLNAKWISNAAATHVINYVLDGGVLPEGAVVEFAEDEGLDALPTPTKEGYDFLGWYDGETKVESIAAGTTSDVTLTARWDIASQVIYYTITYVCEGGVLPADAPTQFQGGVGVELPEPTPNNSSDSFLGWYDEGFNKVDKITANVYRNVVLTAQFGKKKVYTPRWELNQIGFQGQGMTYEIKVLPVTEYDPFNADYTGSSKDIKQSHQTKIESAYDIVVKYTNWEDAAPWGPERVKFINKKYLNDDFGDVYVVTITSQWIPTLVKGSSIAELYDLTSQTGIFAELSYDEETQDEEGYIQDATINQAASVKKKVYGYENGAARPDYFMYYNVDLVKECSLEDPAELWLKGEWTLSNFDEWIKKAQNVLTTKGGYALDMGFAESIIGLTASTGHQMTKVNPPILYMNKTDVTDNIGLLQDYYQSGLYYGRGVQDVSPGFAGGTTLLHHGDLWFMKESTRFNPTKMTFVIGVVPYPAADGEGGIPVTTTDIDEAISIGNDEYLTNENGEYITSVDMSESSFKIPFTGTGCYAVLNVENGKNNINSTVIMHILHDLVAGLGDDPNKLVNLTPEESYRNFLETKFDRAIDVEVIMSCQGTTYFEIMELLSMTVGGGSHFGDGAWWPLAASIIKSQDSPVTAINEVLPKYKQAMKDLGYNIN